MQLDQKILDRFDQLIVQGNDVAQTKTSGRAGVTVDYGAANQWGTSCLHLFRIVFGDDSTHVAKFDGYFGNWAYGGFEAAFGILKAAKDDYEHDMLFDTRTLITAEVFDDFLEQAEALHSAGYYQPAAVVAGAVLEDGLRKLCDRQGIPLPAAPKLDRMNADLAKAGAYNQLWQKQVTALADLRNKAAHGQWDQFSQDQTMTMLQQVRAFMTTFFS